MLGFAPQWNQNGFSRVTFADTFCKETASCPTNIAPPSPTRPGPATSASSSVALLLRWRCCFGSSLATNRKPVLTAVARPILSRLKRPLRLTPSRQPRLIQLHQPRLTLSRPHRLIQLRQLRLTLSRLRPLTQLSRPQPHLLIRNTAGLRAGTDLSLLGGHHAVSALFSFAHIAAPKLPTGMTLC